MKWHAGFLRISNCIFKGKNGKIPPAIQARQKGPVTSGFLPSKCVGINVIIVAGTSRFLLEPAWLPHSKAKGRKHNAIAWIFVHRAELVHFMLRQCTELGFPFSLSSQIPQIGSDLVAENGFAESVKPAAFSIIVRDVFHFLTPNLRESEKQGPVPSPPVSMLLRQLRPTPKDLRNRQNSPGRS